MNFTDDQLLDLLVDAALAGLDEGDSGAELRRLGNLHPHLRADLYGEVVAQMDAQAKLGLMVPATAPLPVADEEDDDGDIWRALVLLLGGATVAGAMGGIAVGGMFLLGRWWAS